MCDACGLAWVRETLNDCITHNRVRLVCAIVLSVALHALFFCGVRGEGFRADLAEQRNTSYTSNLFVLLREPKLELSKSALASATDSAEFAEVREPVDSKVADNSLPMQSGNKEQKNLPTDTQYYSPEGLTKLPKVLQIGDLETPEMSMYRVSGRLVLLLAIDAGGRVVDISVEDTELPKLFSEVAKEAFKRARFSPGERDGVAVGSKVRIEIGYEDKVLPFKPSQHGIGN